MFAGVEQIVGRLELTSRFTHTTRVARAEMKRDSSSNVPTLGQSSDDPGPVEGR